MTPQEWEQANLESDRSMVLVVVGIMAVIALFVSVTLVAAWWFL